MANFHRLTLEAVKDIAFITFLEAHPRLFTVCALPELCFSTESYRMRLLAILLAVDWCLLELIRKLLIANLAYSKVALGIVVD